MQKYQSAESIKLNY